MSLAAEVFAEGDSLVHRIDPAARLAGLFGLSLAAATSQRMEGAVLALAFAGLLTVLARLPISRVAARLAVVNGFTLFLWLFLPFSQPGHAVFGLWGLTATAEGLRLAVLITLKTNAVVLAVLALAATIPANDLGRALQRLRLPDKLCHLLLFTYRYLHVIERELSRMKDALKARAFAPGTNLHTYRTYAYLVGMLLVRSLDQAERAHGAMLCRGFDGRFRTLNGRAFRAADAVFLAGLLACAVAVAWEGLAGGAA